MFGFRDLFSSSWILKPQILINYQSAAKQWGVYFEPFALFEACAVEAGETEWKEAKYTYLELILLLFLFILHSDGLHSCLL